MRHRKRLLVVLITYLILMHYNIYSKVDINDIKVKYNYAISLMAEGKYKEASKIFKNCLTQKEILPEKLFIFCHIDYAYANFGLGNYVEVIKIIKNLENITNITNIYKKDLMLLKYLYVSYRKVKNYEKTINYLDLLLKIQKDSKLTNEIWRTEVDKADIFITIFGKYTEGLNILKKYEGINDALIYENIGIAYYNLGKIELAKKYLLKSIQMDKGNTHGINRFLFQLINYKNGKIEKVSISKKIREDIFKNQTSFLPNRYKFDLAIHCKNQEAAKRFLKEARGFEKIKYYYLYLKTFNRTLLYILIPVLLLILVGLLPLINLIIRKL